MTQNELALVAIAKQLMPAKFLSKINDDNIILAYLQLVLSDINAIPPYVGYTLDNMPASWQSIIAFGAQTYATLFLQANYALNDFSYSNGGISLNIDRHGNLDLSYKNMYENYLRMGRNLKRIETMRLGLNVNLTPQFSSIFAGYITALFPGSNIMR